MFNFSNSVTLPGEITSGLKLGIMVINSATDTVDVAGLSVDSKVVTVDTVSCNAHPINKSVIVARKGKVCNIFLLFLKSGTPLSIGLRELCRQSAAAAQQWCNLRRRCRLYCQFAQTES